ncbi:metallophosphoesterase [Ruegeria sp.]|uniref:metallophosphoesterase n=1 Tax=Ruegeria sp. TaxID=1879320 RepID=UPI0023156E94|nr:metallophosphoesterase [Ruegeria sp.]MDA7963535.1 metallophosphoesterase [Ruegeria sp.]
MKPAWITRLLKRRTADTTEVAAVAPETRFYAIGDIHGRLDLLQSLLARLDPECPIVFVGDYVDRGEQSAQVLRHLFDLSDVSDRQMTCLMGNHEEMLLQFLDMPEYTSRLWLRNGGLQTLASFGVSCSDDPDDDQARAVAAQLRRAMGETLIDWLHTRPLTWTSGNVTVVHAGLDPTRPVDHQHRQTCLWGHRLFPRTARTDGQWVLHGHTITPAPRSENGVISIDTGAFATGRLTAAEVSPAGVQFISTG